MQTRSLAHLSEIQKIFKAIKEMKTEISPYGYEIIVFGLLSFTAFGVVVFFCL